MLESAILYLKRNKAKTIIIVISIAVIILGEIVGLLLGSASEKTEKDAYLYNGAALIINDESGNFTKADYDNIRKIDHVTGLGGWMESVVLPMDTSNVKDHTGEDPVDRDVRGYADRMVFVASMDVAKYSIFSWEKNVSLVEGEFPSYENKGIIVEQRYAQKNGLKVGDCTKYQIGDTKQEAELRICGIYKADTDFEILDSNDEGTSVYIHSPYNTIYLDYDFWVESMNLEYTAATGSEIYVDDKENIDSVKEKLEEMYGSDVQIDDNTSTYLDTECRVVGLMGKTSKMICWMWLVLGEIILLLIFSFFTLQYQKETGLFMILGRSRGWCIGRFMIIGLGYIVGGLILGICLYGILGNGICSLISNISGDVISNSISRAIGGYETPGIHQGFEVRISMGLFFNFKNIFTLLGLAAMSWCFVLILPIWSSLKNNARKLLNLKG